VREVTPGLTPFQTAGPFLSIGLRAGLPSDALVESGDRVVITGRLLDGAGEGIGDGALEFWQPALRAFHRVLTGPDGGYRVELARSPYAAVVVVGRGILTRYYTRLYLEDAPDLNGDPVLRLVPDARRKTLLARKIEDCRYHFDVIVQGADETVFFDV
jgi:protocatechuate 3,4-dioxygenase, alpha subunit